MSVAPVIVTASSRVAVVGTWLAARRREWCRVLLDFPPDQAGHDPMIATRTAVLDGGYTNITDWIDLAHRAEAVGHPQTWLISGSTSVATVWLWNVRTIPGAG